MRMLFKTIAAVHLPTGQLSGELPHGALHLETYQEDGRSTAAPRVDNADKCLIDGSMMSFHAVEHTTRNVA